MPNDFAQLDPKSILLIGSILMICACAGLLAVRLGNARLKGIGWLGAAFASGGMGTFLLALSGSVPHVFGEVLSDVLIASAYVLFHIAVLALKQNHLRISLFGIWLLVGQLTVSSWLTFVYPARNLRLSFLSLAIALQVAHTIAVLVRESHGEAKISSLFTAAVLGPFLIFILYRFAADLFPHKFPATGRPFENLVFIVFIASALGMAFGFFWMTTAELTI